MTGENENDDKEPASEERPLTRGERIQQKRREKAQSKVERRGREAEQLEQRAIGLAEQARDSTREIVRESGGKIALVLMAALAILVTVAVVRDMMAGEREAKARALGEADAVAEPSERASALGEIAGDDAESPLAVWARLGEGAALLESGDAEGAERAFDAILRAESLEPFELRLTLEGLAAARIAGGQTDAAKEAYTRLADVEARGARDAAELGLARLLAEEGKRDEARALLDGLVARRKEAGRQGRGFTSEEAEALASALEGG